MGMPFEEEVPGTTPFYLLIFAISVIFPTLIVLAVQSIYGTSLELLGGLFCGSWFFIFIIIVWIVILNDRVWEWWYKFYNRKEEEKKMYDERDGCGTDYFDEQRDRKIKKLESRVDDLEGELKRVKETLKIPEVCSRCGAIEVK